MRALLYAVLLASPALASDIPVAVTGLPASLGRGGRVAARLTYDRAKAAEGGWLFAAQSPGASDAAAARASAGLVAGSGGLMGPAAAAARRYGVPALLLSRGRWTKEGLKVQVPEYGPPVPHPDGFSYRLVLGFSERLLAEGEVATLDARRGLLRLHPKDEWELELSLGQALSAYDGLRDAQALVLWLAGHPEAVAAARLVEELAERLAAGTAAPEDFARVRRAALAGLPSSQAGVLTERERRLLARHGRQAAEDIARLGDDLREAATRRAVERLQREAGARVRNLEALARALGAKPPPEAAAARARLAARGDLPEGGDLSAAARAAGAAVPERAVLPSSIYERFIKERDMAPLIEDIAQDAGLPLPKKAERLAALFEGVAFDPSSPLAKEILSRLPPGPVYSVSSLDAGRRGVDAAGILMAVKGAWAFHWGAQALGERKRAGRPLHPSPEVLIESSPPEGVEGVLFTRDPVTGSRLRAAVVSGEEQHILERASAEPLLPSSSGKGAFSAADLKTLARVARVLDLHFGEGQEVRFVLAAGKLFVTEARAMRDAAAALELPAVDAAPAPSAAPLPIKSIK